MLCWKESIIPRTRATMLNDKTKNTLGFQLPLLLDGVFSETIITQLLFLPPNKVNRSTVALDASRITVNVLNRYPAIQRLKVSQKMRKDGKFGSNRVQRGAHVILAGATTQRRIEPSVVPD
mmetsp:Transcript_14185/g.39266  ORF Transcript_14185/g.39266 Transcript_14185/m.39266 type:complete len:121 (+) Transcript_14185:1344-1706(+)